MEGLIKRAKELLAKHFNIKNPGRENLPETLDMMKIIVMMDVDQKLGELLSIDGLKEALGPHLRVVEPKEEAAEAAS